MLARIQSATLQGIDGRRVDVEVHVSNGFPGFTMVGLPDAAVREARDRVRAALLSCGLGWPQRRVTVNLAPSGVRKCGPGLDLPIAVGLLVAQGDLRSESVADTMFVGELGLDGSVRPVGGIIPMLTRCTASRVVVPEDCGVEAALVVGERVRTTATLSDLVAVLRGCRRWGPPPQPARSPDESVVVPDLADVRGQRLGRRAVEVAAAGGHHLLMVGPPGSGKTLLAQRLPGLLPPLSRHDALEVARVQSAAGMAVAGGGLPTRPPFRAPHHGATASALAGGGSWLRPGEISLAHRGVLFLDELAEFSTVVIDMLREPLEEGVIRVSRARATVELPARFLLVGAMNPCPCGEGVVRGACRCSEAARARYARRLSGPLLDRFDIAVSMGRPEPTELFELAGGEPSAVVASRVARVRKLAVCRGVPTNAAIPPNLLDRWAPLCDDAARLLHRQLRSGFLSARGLHRIRRVARTVADLEMADLVEERHVAEALQLHTATAAFGRQGDDR